MSSQQNDRGPGPGYALYHFIVARKKEHGDGYYPDEFKNVSAPDEASAMMALAQWSPGIWIKKRAGINAPGQGGYA